jgi:hypothetical protein
VPDQDGSTTGWKEVVAVLRLVVSAQGALQYGEAIDVETEARQTFRGWSGMGKAINELVTDALAANRSEAPGPPGPDDDRRST